MDYMDADCPRMSDETTVTTTTQHQQQEKESTQNKRQYEPANADKKLKKERKAEEAEALGNSETSPTTDFSRRFQI